MRTNSKPILILSGAILLLGAFCQPTQAQGIVAGTMTDALILGSTVEANSTATDITVDSWVTLTGSIYTYDYIINDPTTVPVGNFSVSFNASNPTEYIPGTQTGGIINENNGASGLGWVISVSAGGHSGTLSFQSDDAPTLFNGNASGSGGQPSPWASSSSPTVGGQPFLGQELFVPSPVPEPSTTALLAGLLIFLPFRSNLLNKKQRE